MILIILYRDLGISHIVNMAGELENEYPEEFKYLSVKLDDTSSDNIAEHFENTLKFIGMMTVHLNLPLINT